MSTGNPFEYSPIGGASEWRNGPLTTRTDMSFENYNAAIGYLRPFEDWGINKVMPLQFLTIGLGFNYNY